MNKKKAKEMIELIDLIRGSGMQPLHSTLRDRAIGKYVIVRSQNEGVNCGEVVACDETGVVLKNARRLYYHKPKDTNLSWYEGVAETGLHKDSKVSGTVAEKIISENYSITTCSDVAIKSLIEHEANKQIM